mmetsp:Transcript_212/g.710  ORF Transcript_212/g.710 Transcript_212/m.710 type:complete len:225 (+) Transcript_212:292-966(+)
MLLLPQVQPRLEIGRIRALLCLKLDIERLEVLPLLFKQLASLHTHQRALTLVQAELVTAPAQLQPCVHGIAETLPSQHQWMLPKKVGQVNADLNHVQGVQSSCHLLSSCRRPCGKHHCFCNIGSMALSYLLSAWKLQLQYVHHLQEADVVGHRVFQLSAHLPLHGQAVPRHLSKVTLLCPANALSSGCTRPSSARLLTIIRTKLTHHCVLVRNCLGSRLLHVCL